VHFDQIGLKDFLDWLMPLILTWVGGSLVRYLKSSIQEIRQAKESIIELNQKMGRVIEVLQDHEIRIQKVEHKKK
jgi:hypothetical protein